MPGVVMLRAHRLLGTSACPRRSVSPRPTQHLGNGREVPVPTVTTTDRRAALLLSFYSSAGKKTLYLLCVPKKG